MGFGIAGVNSKMGQDYASHSLIGCYVNGVLYGDTTLAGINQIGFEIPSSFSLHQNYPNPFNPITNIRFNLPKNGFVTLKVFDIIGREVTTLVNEKLCAGSYETEWDGSGYPSGVYFYRLQTESFIETKKMVLLK